MRLRCLVPLLLATALVWLVWVNITFAQGCPPGSRPAQPGEAAKARSLGAQIPENSTCIDGVIDRLFLSGTLQQDIEYLKNRVCPTLNNKPLSYGLPAGFNANNDDPANWNAIRQGHVYFSAGNASMNPGALKCFRQFFEAAEAKSLQPCITAGFRTPAHQRSSCRDTGNKTVCGRSDSGAGPASTCWSDLDSYKVCSHTTGIALDVNEKAGRLNQLLAMARSFNGFTKVGAGALDPWHIEAGGCADANYRPSFNTNDNWSGQTTSQAPTAALSNAFRQVLGVPTQPMLPPQPMLPQQPIAAAQPILNSFGQPVPTVNATGSPNPSIPTVTPGGVSEQLLGGGQYGNATGTSLADRLQELAFGISTGGATSGIPFIPLFINPNDRSDRVATATVATTTKTNTIYALQPAQQTFASNDLWYTGQTVGAPAYTGFGGILENIRQTLLSLLQYLRPFGNRPVQYVEGE